MWCHCHSAQIVSFLPQKQLIRRILIFIPIAIARCIEKRLPLKKKRAKHPCFKPPDLSWGLNFELERLRSPYSPPLHPTAGVSAASHGERSEAKRRDFILLHRRFLVQVGYRPVV